MGFDRDDVAYTYRQLERDDLEVLPRKDLARITADRAALRADLKALAVALYELRAYTAHPGILNIANEALSRSGVQAVLEGVKDAK